MMSEQDSAVPTELRAYWDQVLLPEERDAYIQELALQRARALLGMGAILGEMTDEETAVRHLGNVRARLQGMHLNAVQGTAETIEKLAAQMGVEPYTGVGKIGIAVGTRALSSLASPEVVEAALVGVPNLGLTAETVSAADSSAIAITEPERSSESPVAEMVVPFIKISRARKMALGKIFGDSYRQLKKQVGDREATVVLDKLIDKYATKEQVARLKAYFAGKSDEEIIAEENRRTGGGILTAASQTGRSRFYQTVKNEELSFAKLFQEAQGKVQRMAAKGQIAGAKVKSGRTTDTSPRATTEVQTDQLSTHQIRGLQNMFEEQANDYLVTLTPQEAEYIIDKMINQFATDAQKARLKAYFIENKNSFAIALEETARTNLRVSDSAIQKGRSLFYKAVAKQKLSLAELIDEARRALEAEETVISINGNNDDIAPDTTPNDGRGVEPDEPSPWSYTEQQARLTELMESKAPLEQLMRQMHIFANSVGLQQRDSRELREWFNEQLLQSLSPYVERGLVSLEKRYHVVRSRGIEFNDLEITCLRAMLGDREQNKPPVSAFDARRNLAEVLAAEHVSLTDVLLSVMSKVNSLVTSSVGQ